MISWNIPYVANEGNDGIWAQAAPLIGGFIVWAHYLAIRTSSDAPLKIRFHFPKITNLCLIFGL